MIKSSCIWSSTDRSALKLVCFVECGTDNVCKAQKNRNELTAPMFHSSVIVFLSEPLVANQDIDDTFLALRGNCSISPFLMVYAALVKFKDGTQQHDVKNIAGLTGETL